MCAKWRREKKEPSGAGGVFLILLFLFCLGLFEVFSDQKGRSPEVIARMVVKESAEFKAELIHLLQRQIEEQQGE